MNIVLEGPDGSGKSTLAHVLQQHVPFTYVPGGGPPHYPGEMIERVKKYLALDNSLFDRHPCVSQPIYGSFRNDPKNTIPDKLIHQFYESKPFIVYCGSVSGFHNLKNYDTPVHVKMINDFEDRIRRAYTIWAIHHSHFSYHIGMEIQPLINKYKEYCYAQQALPKSQD